MSENPYEAPKHLGTAPDPGLPRGQQSNTGLAVASLVLGIVGIVTDCCCWPVGATLGIAAIITGFLALNQVKEGTGGGKGMATAGLICGIAAIALGILSLILGLVLNLPGMMDQLQRM